LAKRELVDAALSLPFSKAAPKVTLNAGGCLVAFLSSLGEQLHDDCRDGCRDILPPLARGHRHPRDMAMNPVQPIVFRREGPSVGL
jgi:hypothetical protein